MTSITLLPTGAIGLTENVALQATCTQSSFFLNLDKFRCIGAIDGINDKGGDGHHDSWVSNSEGVGAWMTITLSKPAGVVNIEATNGRGSLSDLVRKVEVSFDNGEKREVRNHSTHINC